jgi:predicted Fe-S protein YdhL (DUF1289 family)
MSSNIESPCKQQCKLDPKSQQCTVCRRTLEQVINWVRYTPLQRSQIMDSLR